MSERRWTLEFILGYGYKVRQIEGKIMRSRQVIEVIPADHPAVLLPVEARLLAEDWRKLSEREILDMDKLITRLAGYAKENS